MTYQELQRLARDGRLPWRAVGWAGPLPAVGEIVYHAVDTDNNYYEQYVIGQSTPRLGIPAVVEMPLGLFSPVTVRGAS